MCSTGQLGDSRGQRPGRGLDNALANGLADGVKDGVISGAEKARLKDVVHGVRAELLLPLTVGQCRKGLGYAGPTTAAGCDEAFCFKLTVGTGDRAHR